MTDEAPTTHPHARIADLLGTHVDVVRSAGLRSKVRAAAEAEAVEL